MKPAVLLLSAAVVAPCLCAQVPENPTVRSNMQVSEHSVIFAALRGPVTGKPYSAQEMTRSVQHLGDGTTITHESHGMFARSSTGLLREDMHITHSSSIGTRDINRDTTSITVADPTAHTVTIWHDDPKSRLKTAIVMDMPNVSGLKKTSLTATITAPPPPPPHPFDGTSIRLGKAGAGPHLETDTHTEDLGQQSIEGLLVTGKRTTTVIALGKIGNDRPITITHEVWTSPDLGIVVKQIDNDPRTGEETMELTNISRGDPDNALFHPPAGYTVQNMTDMMKKLGQIGKTPDPAH